MKKKIKRIRRSTKTRKLIKKLNICRLVFHRSLRHIYAQIISKDNKKVLATASTLEKNIISSKIKKNNKKNFNNKKYAYIIGDLIAKRALKIGINNVAFDRSGFKYHGKVKKLAESARKAGLIF